MKNSLSLFGHGSAGIILLLLFLPACEFMAGLEKKDLPGTDAAQDPAAEDMILDPVDTDAMDPVYDDVPHDQPVDIPFEEIECESDHTPPFITVNPTAQPTITTALIRWETDEFSTSFVDYGTSEVLDQTASDLLYTMLHLVRVVLLDPATVYYYRVRSIDACGNEATSGIGTFTTAESLPLPAPVLVDEPDIISPGPADVALEWSVVETTDGDPTEYLVEADDDPAFASPNYSSGWIGTTTWEVTVETDSVYTWRARARDSIDTAIVSPWSATDAFRIMESAAPPAPTLVPEPDYDSLGLDAAVTLDWNPVTDPDGDPVEYHAQIDDSLDFLTPNFESPWQTGVSWTLTLPPGYTWYWRARARDAAHTGSVSDWSAFDSFYDLWGSSSCPFIYVWNGESYSHITDVQGNILGLDPVSRVSKNVHLFGEDYIVLQGLEPDDKGLYRIKLRETLPEISYADEVTLLAVDVPEGYGVVSTSAENTYRYGYANPAGLLAVKEGRPPLSAVDRLGRDILEKVSAADGVPAPLDPAVAEYYEFDFGPVENPAYARLIIDGWAMFGRPYYTKKHVEPMIEVIGKDGAWVKARPLGFVSGDFKRMAVDISNAFATDDHRIRVHTGITASMRWVIDRIALDESIPAPMTAQEMILLSASLGFEGKAPHQVATPGHRILATDGRLPPVPAALGFGAFTRYGSVKTLLTSTEGRMVIMRHGDALTMTFSAPEPLPTGLKRVFVLKALVYYKAFRVSRNVDPLPFPGMPSYPYPEELSPFKSPEFKSYFKKYGTRIFLPKKNTAGPWPVN
jgi:hypothetical protein